MYRVIFNKMTKWYLQISLIFMTTTAYKFQRRYVKLIKDFSTSILRNRKRRLSEMFKNNLVYINTESPEINLPLSVIDRFIISKELSPKELLDETFTVFTSSQEASAKIASSLLLMLAYHPQYQEMLYEEICRVIGTKSNTVTNENLKGMPYLDLLFKEVLRLFPIGAMLQRTVMEDIRIKSCTVPAGSSIVIPIYHLHRDPRYWMKPNEFIPDRFTPENVKKRNPYCYIPFSLGAMDCLGRHFATQLIKTICVKVLQKFKISSRNEFQNLRIIISISAEVVDGYNIILTSRNE